MIIVRIQIVRKDQTPNKPIEGEDAVGDGLADEGANLRALCLLDGYQQQCDNLRNNQNQ
jgi:hypothetical protein